MPWVWPVVLSDQGLVTWAVQASRPYLIQLYPVALPQLLLLALILPSQETDGPGFTEEIFGGLPAQLAQVLV
jgi:hypothetical protein